jgi:hypothetical protein
MRALNRDAIGLAGRGSQPIGIRDLSTVVNQRLIKNFIYVLRKIYME